MFVDADCNTLEMGKKWLGQIDYQTTSLVKDMYVIYASEILNTTQVY